MDGRSRKHGHSIRTLLPALAIATTLAQPAAAKDGCSKFQPTRPGEIYFMRGLANIFSLGLDAFAKEVSAMGIENCVFNHTHWQAVVNDIVERSYRNQVNEPVIIIGHSLGANIAPTMASQIGSQNIKVRYVVMMDPVEPTRVGFNVDEIINYYIPKSKDTKLYPKKNFNGLLTNMDLTYWREGFDHFNIDEKLSLRREIRRRIDEVVSEEEAARQVARN